MLKDIVKTKGRPTKRPPEKELAELYKIHTAKEIAEQYGVAYGTVKAWISYYRKQEVRKDD